MQMMNNVLIGTIVAITIILLLWLMFSSKILRNNKKILEEENKKCSDNNHKKDKRIDGKIQKYISSNEEKIIENKINTLIIFGFLSVQMTGFIDVVVKQIAFKIKWSNLEEWANAGIIVIVGMVISSLVMKSIIFKSNVIPLNIKSQRITKRMLLNSLSYSYVISVIGVILGMLLTEDIGSAITWIAILLGKYIWFGSFDGISVSEKQDNTVAKGFWKITSITLVLYFFTIIAVKLNSSILTTILITTGITLLIAGSMLIWYAWHEKDRGI